MACGGFIAWDLPEERFSFIELTDEKGGERLDRTPFAKGDIAIADRGYMHPEPLAHIVEQGADVIVRTPWTGARWLSEQPKRLAKRFAVAAAAGELAIKLKVLPWKAGEAHNAAVACFEDCRDALGHSGANAHEIEEGIQQIRAVIERDGSSRFQPWLEPEPPDHSSLGFCEGLEPRDAHFLFSS